MRLILGGAIKRLVEALLAPSEEEGEEDGTQEDHEGEGSEEEEVDNEEHARDLLEGCVAIPRPLAPIDWH